MIDFKINPINNVDIKTALSWIDIRQTKEQRSNSYNDYKYQYAPEISFEKTTLSDI